MEMKSRLFRSCLVTVVITVSASTNAVGAVYKCVDKLGNTGYQAKPCDDLRKSTQVEIKNFEKPAALTTQESEARENSNGQGARNEAAKRKEKQRVAACTKLKKKYGKDLRKAKVDDAARKQAEENYAQKRQEQDRKMLNTYKKNKRKYKKQLKKRKKAESRYRRSVSLSYNVDRVKGQYKSDKKRLGCDSI